MPRGAPYRASTPLGVWLRESGRTRGWLVEAADINPSTATRLLAGYPASPAVAKRLHELSGGKLDPWQLMGVE